MGRPRASCPGGGRRCATGCGPTTRAAGTSWTGSAPRGRCRRASCRTPARCRGSRPGGPTTATSASCWSSWCCGARSRSPGGRGGDRLWDLASRVYPDDPVVPADEALRTRDERRLRALGIARARGPECPVEPCDVGEAGEAGRGRGGHGARGGWTPPSWASPSPGATALLSPFDRLIHDRKRTVELFEFDYQLEMYKPAARRRWGYFALPILYGDRLVGQARRHSPTARPECCGSTRSTRTFRSPRPWRRPWMRRSRTWRGGSGSSSLCRYATATGL